MFNWGWILYLMVACQMIAWGWFSKRGGELSDKQFFLFTAGMLIGQLGAGIDTWGTSWPTFYVQVYFFFFTAFGGIQRWRKRKLV